jgi:hypothetical protein
MQHFYIIIYRTKLGRRQIHLPNQFSRNKREKYNTAPPFLDLPLSGQVLLFLKE